MGMTGGQLFWRVEMPLAVPEIIAGLRIATVSTVAIATLAVFAGAGGLGDVIYNGGSRATFKTGIVLRRACSDRDGDRPRRCCCWSRSASSRRGGRCGRYEPALSRRRLPRHVRRRLRVHLPAAPHSAQPGSAVEVGGLDQVWELLARRLVLSARGAGRSRSLIALPLGVYLGHRGKGEFVAVAVGNAGRADPRARPDRSRRRLRRTSASLNVDDRGDDPRDPADPHQHLRRGQPGRSQRRRGGARDGHDRVGDHPQGRAAARACRRSWAASGPASVNIVATSTIGSLAGVDTLGNFILGQNVYGERGRDRGRDPGRAARARLRARSSPGSSGC